MGKKPINSDKHLILVEALTKIVALRNYHDRHDAQKIAREALILFAASSAKD